MRKLMLLALVGTLACGKSDEQKAAEAAMQQLAEMSKAIGAEAAKAGIPQGTPGTMEALAAGKAKDAVAYQDLKDLMPEDINGMPRASHEGEKNSAMGFTISRAEARYETQGTNASMRIEISDIGAMTGMAALATFGWATMDMSNENDNGYERTTSLKGYRGYERFDKQSNFSEIQILVGGRFVVRVEGNEVPMEVVKAALDQIDLGKLEGMKGFGM
jgi:hypothetical protein